MDTHSTPRHLLPETQDEATSRLIREVAEIVADQASPHHQLVDGLLDMLGKIERLIDACAYDGARSLIDTTIGLLAEWCFDDDLAAIS